MACSIALIRTFTEEGNFIKFLQFAQPVFYQEGDEKFCKQLLAYYTIVVEPDIEYARILLNKYTRENTGEQIMPTVTELKRESYIEGHGVGHKEGRGEGIQEVGKAIKMLKRGHSIETIQKATGLSREELVKAEVIPDDILSPRT